MSLRMFWGESFKIPSLGVGSQNGFANGELLIVAQYRIVNETIMVR